MRNAHEFVNFEFNIIQILLTVDTAALSVLTLLIQSETVGYLTILIHHIPLYTQININIVIIFSKQNLFSFKWDQSTGIKYSTKVDYSLWDKYRAQKCDLNTDKT